MKRFLWLLAMAAPAAAHVMSMSQGDLAIDGTRAHYELRMPLYEVAHVSAPERTLLEHIHFAGGRLTHSECRSEASRDSYVCAADYEFGAPVDNLEVECTFPAITVPNHVHLLRASMGGKRDEAIFDLGFTRQTLRFRPPTAAEIAITQSGAGAVRALGGAAQILLLAALVMAARTRRELLAIAGMFLAGQTACVLAMTELWWQPPARFVEAATALAVAYLAVEILFLPQAGARWLVACMLGALHGLYFHLFVQSTGYHAALVMAGAALAQVAAIALLALVLSRLGRAAQAFRPVQVAASMLLVVGMVWFFLRLRS
ncbi:MAG: HupE/UreJ family protein [Candidatus Solibacter sp.]